MKVTRFAVPFAVLVASFLGTAPVARLASDPAKERHETMEAVGSGMKAMVSIAKKETPFDAAVVEKNAGAMAENLEKASKLFPEGSGGGESRAKAEIWSDAAGFEKAMKDGIAAAKALQAVKDEAAFGPAMQAVGASCKSCHDKYRLPRK
jgi:cytochrome c556